VNRVFQSTAILDERDAAWRLPPAGVLARVAQGAGSTLVMLSLGLTIVAAMLHPQASHVALIALACAGGGLTLLRESAAMQVRLEAAQGLLDPATGLYNAKGLMAASREPVAAARRLGRESAVIVIEFDDLLEVRTIYGRDTSRKVVARIVRRLQAVAGTRGIAARTEAARFVVVLPGVSPSKARAAVDRVLGKPGRIEFDAGESEIVLVPDILCDTDDGEIAIDQVFDAAAGHLRGQRERELRRRLYLQRERERHSRPMSLPPSRH
jgi:diguanylate cyclase (GGDEF)-like protein